MQMNNGKMNTFHITDLNESISQDSWPGPNSQDHFAVILYPLQRFRIAQDHFKVVWAPLETFKIALDRFGRILQDRLICSRIYLHEINDLYGWVSFQDRWVMIHHSNETIKDHLETLQRAEDYSGSCKRLRDRLGILRIVLE